MNEDQHHAVQMAKEGHSFFLTGQAGTGKTFTTLEIIETLKNQGKNILVTAYTGIACSQLSKYCAQTVNKTFGLRDGRYSEAQLDALFSDSEIQYQNKKKRILKPMSSSLTKYQWYLPAPCLLSTTFVSL